MTPCWRDWAQSWATGTAASHGTGRNMTSLMRYPSSVVLYHSGDGLPFSGIEGNDRVIVEVASNLTAMQH